MWRKRKLKIPIMACIRNLIHHSLQLRNRLAIASGTSIMKKLMLSVYTNCYANPKAGLYISYRKGVGLGRVAIIYTQNKQQWQLKSREILHHYMLNNYLRFWCFFCISVEINTTSIQVLDG